MPLSDKDIEELALTASSAMQELQNELGRKNIVAARVRFPRGYITTADANRATLPDIGTEVQRRNATYALMNIDVLRWMVVRTDISASALSMIVKNAICIRGAICEWMTKEGTRGHASNRPYKQRTEKLVELGIIDEALSQELDWVWDIRCREHIHEIDTLEHDTYSRDDYNRALRAYSGLRKALVKKHGRAF